MLSDEELEKETNRVLELMAGEHVAVVRRIATALLEHHPTSVQGSLPATCSCGWRNAQPFPRATWEEHVAGVLAVRKPWLP
jgi:hypothetical protein